MRKRSATQAIDATGRELERLRDYCDRSRINRKLAHDQCLHIIEMLAEYEQKPRGWLWRAIGSAHQRLLSTIARTEDNDNAHKDET